MADLLVRRTPATATYLRSQDPLCWLASRVVGLPFRAVVVPQLPGRPSAAINAAS